MVISLFCIYLIVYNYIKYLFTFLIMLIKNDKNIYKLLK